MAGGNPPKPPSNKPPNRPPPSSHRNKSHRESSATTTPSNKKPSTSEPGKPKPSSNNPKPPTPKPKPNKYTNKPSPKPSYPSPNPDQNRHSKLPPFPFLDPPPPPAYGYHLLDRRTIVLADGSVRSYLALPPDYQDFTSLPPPREFRGPGITFDRKIPMSPDFRGPEFRPEVGGRGDGFMRSWSQEHRTLGFEGRGNGPGMVEGPRPGIGPGNLTKRKFGDEEREGRDGFERQRQQLLQYGKADGNLGGMPGASRGYMGKGEEMRAAKYMRTDEVNVGKLKHNGIDQVALKKAFLHFVKIIYDDPNQKKKYLADGKQGSLKCIACKRSKDFSDMHGLIMHVYSSDHANLIVDHLGLHKAFCILMGWNYRTPPDNSKVYQFLSAEEAAANLSDLIIWPPLVIIHNTNTGKGREGRTEGLGNRAMDNYLRDLGFQGGKSKTLYSRDGHLGITLIKFGADQSGLKEAVQLAEYFEKEKRGRNGWAHIESLNLGKDDDDSNPNLVKVDEMTREKKRIFYGYLATITDMDKLDPDTRKKSVIQSRRDWMPPK
ncbi:uncharacterized protein LOC113765354 [Coffea eugenioides]|uniref:uncharacterized protein LOC113765354 n=1 Tax=Coffea eugenioides TaxID=49369 RepID=UPI000F614AB3|nr:uncharacterized protein LOC113765354 [Coffea eugenioides]